MNEARLKKLESKLSFDKRKAAILLVENELARDGEEKKSHQKVADEVGISRMSLYRWRTQDPAFIEYMNLLADDMLSAHRSEVYSQLMKLIRGSGNGSPSVKAIDLFMRRFGLLTERQITETNEGENSRSDEDIEKETKELDELLAEDADTDVGGRE